MKRITLHNPANLSGSPVSATFLGEEFAKLKANEEVQLVDVRDQDLTYAEVLSIWVGPLSHAPALLLEMAGDPLQRTFSGLFMHLVARRATEETKVSEDKTITILVLRPKASTLIRPTMNDLKKMGQS